MAPSPSSPLLLRSFRRHLADRGVVKHGQSLLLAVSGGIDSMVMLDLFLRLAGPWRLTLGVVHAHHQLRGAESDGDESFVRDAAQRAHLPFFSRRLPTVETQRAKHISRQLAARQLRYAWFEEARLAAAADFVLTAHNADDNAETVLMNLIRGTGIRGLAGIPSFRREGRIVRPLLFATRREIARYARTTGVDFREDSSNRSVKYTRNAIRLRILPALQKRHATDIRSTLCAVAATFDAVGGVLHQRVDAFWQTNAVRRRDGSISLSLTRWNELHEMEKGEAMLRLFGDAGVEPSDAKLRAALALCEGQAGRRGTISRGWMLVREAGALTALPVRPSPAYDFAVQEGTENVFGDFGLSISSPMPRPATFDPDPLIAFVDADRLRGPLHVRTWHTGDWFIPLGMRGKKKLSDFFADQKIPRQEKGRIPLLESCGDILWICGRRLDDRYKLTSRTTRVLKLIYHPTLTGTP